VFHGTERLPFMRSPLLLESTLGCGQTPHLLVLLQELGAPYELTLRPDGYFLANYGRPGPRLVDGKLTLFELGAMLRHCARTRGDGRLLPPSADELARVDAWLELSGQLYWSAVCLGREESERGSARRPTRISDECSRISGILQLLENALDDSDGDWLLGDFCLADCALAGLPRLSQRVSFDSWPRVRAYCQRLVLRPAVVRVHRLSPSAQASQAEASCSIG
jgi:glutathione S-transferase